MDDIRDLEVQNAYLQRDLALAREETARAKADLEAERKNNRKKSAVAGRLISYYRAGLLEAKSILDANGIGTNVAASAVRAFWKDFGDDPAKEPPCTTSSDGTQPCENAP